MKKIISLSFVIILALASVLNSIASTSKPHKAAPPAFDNASLLPASDVIAVIDVTRLMNELMPRVNLIDPNLEKDLKKFIADTGIDPYQIKSAILGFSMGEKTNQATVIVDGVSLDIERVKTALLNKKEELKTSEYKGRQIFSVGVKQGKKVGIDEEMAFSNLDGNRVAAGTLSGVQAAIDAHLSGESNPGNEKLITLLGQANAGIVRFAAKLPQAAIKDLDAQGDLFAQFASIKSIYGSVDVTANMDAVIDATMRAVSSKEAAKLKTGLAGLMEMGKGILSGFGDPQMKLLSGLIDKIKIGAVDSDVTLSLTIPGTMFDSYAELKKNKGKKEPAK
jgi:hypothetical protein